MYTTRQTHQDLDKQINGPSSGLNTLLKKVHRRLVDRLCFEARAVQRSFGCHRPAYFCLNTGRCGSTSVVRLLQANGIRNCYHELAPDLFREALDYYRGQLPIAPLAELLRTTRAGVFFEANNRLFSLAHPIKMAFPESKFIFLFRDGREVVRSGLQRGWYGRHDYCGRLRLGHDAEGTRFVKTCRYWAEVNRRILHDLRSLGDDYLSLRFEEFVCGNATDKLESFLRVRLRRCGHAPAANETSQWSVPPYPQWSFTWKRQFEEICGDMMEQLGYAATSEAVMGKTAVGGNLQFD